MPSLGASVSSTPGVSPLMRMCNLSPVTMDAGTNAGVGANVIVSLSVAIRLRCVCGKLSETTFVLELLLLLLLLLPGGTLLMMRAVLVHAFTLLPSLLSAKRI